MNQTQEQIEKLRSLQESLDWAIDLAENQLPELKTALQEIKDKVSNITIDLSPVAKQGKNPEATLSAVYDTLGEIKKVVANVVPKIRVKLKTIHVNDDCIVDGYWPGELVDTSETTSFVDLFRYANSLQQVDVSGWDTRNVTNMANIFVGCSLLQQVDVSGWDTSNVINFDNIFLGCASLQQVDVSNWDTSNATRISGTFPRNLQSIIGGRTIDDVLSNNIGALNGLKISISLTNINLDRASLRAIINGLADLTGQTAQTLTLGATLIAKLTDEDIAIATNKNWTIA